MMNMLKFNRRSNELIPVIKKLFIDGTIQTYTERMTYKKTLSLSNDYIWEWSDTLRTMCMIQKDPYCFNDYTLRKVKPPPIVPPTISLIASEGMIDKVNKILKVEKEAV